MQVNHMRHITSRQRRRGFTLTEIAIVLGIVGLILGAIWVAAAAVYNNLRTSHANTEVLQIAQAIRTLYANTPTITDTAATMPATLISAKAVPGDIVNAAGTGFVDPFPAGVTSIYPTTDSLGFYIAMSGVNQSSCIDLLMAVGGSTRDPGLFLAEGSAGAVAAAATGTPITVVATPALAAAALAGGFGGCVAGVNTATFGFSLRS